MSEEEQPPRTGWRDCDDPWAGHLSPTIIEIHYPIVYAPKKSARDLKVHISFANFDQNPKIHALVYFDHGW